MGSIRKIEAHAQSGFSYNSRAFQHTKRGCVLAKNSPKINHIINFATLCIRLGNGSVANLLRATHLWPDGV